MNWELYLSRPFDLLVTSIWNEWYASPKFESMFGIKLRNALFIESPRGVSCHYRPKEDLAVLRSKVKSMVLDEPGRTIEIFQKANDLNNQAQAMLAGANVTDIAELMDFLIDLALYATVFPLFAGEILATADSSHSKAKEMCDKLRSISYYPEVLSKVLIPAIERLMTEKDLTAIDARLMTIREILSNNFASFLPRRDVAKDNFFMLKDTNGIEQVSYIADPKIVMEEIQGLAQDATQIIRGSVAFPGIVQGRVRLVLGNDPSAQFETGEVLVAISTNPTLAPLMHKASAFVTDEGGVTCHAAIIARELKKPCVIGTKNATQILKTGDLVEVNANTGIVSNLEG